MSRKVLARKDVGIVPDPIYCDTVYYNVHGNESPLFNSVFAAFGSCSISGNYGLEISSLEGGKRPYHTNVPSMITHADTDELHALLGGECRRYCRATSVKGYDLETFFSASRTHPMVVLHGKEDQISR